MQSLKFRLFVAFSIFVIIISLLLSASTYILVKNTMISEMSNSRVDTLSLISQKIDILKQSAETVADLIYNDPIIFGIITSDSIESKNINISDINAHIASLYLKYFDAFQQINAPFYIVLTAENGFNYYSGAGKYDFEKIEKMSWHTKNIGSKTNSYFITNFYDNNRYVQAAVRTFHRSGSNEYTGTLLVCIDERVFFDCYKDILNESNSIYIIDELYRVISHKDTSLIGTTPFPIEDYRFLNGKLNYKIDKKNNDNFLFSKYNSPDSNWIVVEEIPLNSVLRPLNIVVYSMSFILILIYIIAFVLSALMSEKISAPLDMFCKVIETAGDGNLEIAPTIKGYTEIERLSNSFNEMKLRIKKLVEQIKSKERKIRKTELDFLRAQINPHFIYNTLFSIKCTIQMEKPREACHMIGLLIDLLKSTIGSPEATITLYDEINYIKKYIKLQQFRYGNQLNISFDIPEHLLHCRIPKYIIQPIVENAIFHGIEPKGGTGNIKIKVVEKCDDLYITVQDDGVGFSKHNVNILLNKAKNEQRIGLSNINERIKLNFGNNYGLSLLPCEKGSCVSIKLPIVF